MSVTVGIDPGLTGALAAVCLRGMLDCMDLPTCGNGTASGSMSMAFSFRGSAQGVMPAAQAGAQEAPRASQCAAPWLGDSPKRRAASARGNCMGQTR